MGLKRRSTAPSTYNIFHAFSVNSFIDEFAHARGVIRAT
jgi:hypothetical protein